MSPKKAEPAGDKFRITPTTLGLWPDASVILWYHPMANRHARVVSSLTHQAAQFARTCSRPDFLGASIVSISSSVFPFVSGTTITTKTMANTVIAV